MKSPYGARKKTSVSPARSAALAVLRRAADNQAPGADRLIEEQIEANRLSPVDAGLAREIAFGVLRHRAWLDRILDEFLERPLRKIAPDVHNALLLGIYQYVFLDRVPPHAIVDQTVQLVAVQQKGDRFRGLANAILRRVTEKPATDWRPGDDVAWAERYSVPEYLATLASEALPDDECDRFFASCQHPAPLCLRVVGKRAIDEDLLAHIRREGEKATGGAVKVERSRVLPGCVILPDRGLQPDKLPLFQSGRLTVEDEGAQIAGWFTAPRGTESRVLDLCASPGGKTVHLAEQLPATCELIATDVSADKLERLRGTLNRVGMLDRVRVELVDEFLRTAVPKSFDHVLVDAPCSGLGTLRRHPEARYRRSAGEVSRLAATQSTLLNQAARLVAPGGTLAYSVCTFTRAEGEEVVRRFLGDQQQFESDDAPEGLPFDAASFAFGRGMWRTLTHRHGCDCFFIARFRRKA